MPSPITVAAELIAALEYTSLARDLIRLADQIPEDGRADVLDQFNQGVSALKATGLLPEYRRGVFLSLRLTQHVALQDFDLPRLDYDYHIEADDWSWDERVTRPRSQQHRR